MNLSAIFIRRPVMTNLLMAALVIFGIFAYFSLPVSDLPNIDSPTISVTASLPGASPETMASAVATTLERQFSAIAGLASMTSSSTLGTTSITLQFDLARDIDAAAQDVQTAIAAASKQLPPSMPAPPTYKKVNPAESPVLFLAVTSPTLPLSQVDEYAETLVAQRLSTVSGVAQIQVNGAQKYAVRAQVNPALLQARGLGFDDVATAMVQGNSNLPTGTLNGPHSAVTIQSTGKLTQASAFRNVIIAYRNGAPVRLDEVAHVIDSVENTRIAGWFNGVRGIVLTIQRQPGTNTIEVTDGILKLLPELRKLMPASVNLELVYNRADPIRDSVNDVQITLVATAVLVILIIFLFLKNLSATLIPALALPVSLIATFIGMQLLGFNLDNISLMALTLSTGFVVDDAIVMLENIVRHREQGETAMQAALNGSREIGFTILSMTLSLVAVFIPVLFMGGILGRLFREFAVTISLSILISGFVSLTLTPMLCSRILKVAHHDGGTPSAFYRFLDRGFDGMLGVYDRILKGAMRHHVVTMMASLALFGLTAYLFMIVPKGFIPSEDISQISGSTEGAQGISFDDLKEHQQQVAAIVQADKNVAAVVSNAGAGGRAATGNAGSFFIRLKPRHERTKSADQVIDGLRPLLATVPGMRTFMQNPPAIRIGGQATKAAYGLSLKSTETAALYKATPEIESALRDIPELEDVISDLLVRTPAVTLAIDRDRASSLGISAQQIETVLYSAYGTRQVSQIYADTNAYNVILEVAPEFQQDVSDLRRLQVRSASGVLVPLEAVTTPITDVGPVQVNHLDQFPSTTVSFNLKPGVSLGQATDTIRKITDRMLPASVTATFQGSAQAFESSVKGLGILLVIAVIVIYLVLGILYESYIHPLTILSGLPSAGAGALLTLLIFHKELNVFGFVGLIMLIGIVKKNAIMMVDFAVEAQHAGKSAEEAIYEACLVRFRPIMMTTMAALMGTLPIALGIGAGAESRQTLGLAVVGGLVVSQLLTLFITPVVYLYLERWQQRLSPKAAVEAL